MNVEFECLRRHQTGPHIVPPTIWSRKFAAKMRIDEKTSVTQFSEAHRQMLRPLNSRVPVRHGQKEKIGPAGVVCDQVPQPGRYWEMRTIPTRRQIVRTTLGPYVEV